MPHAATIPKDLIDRIHAVLVELEESVSPYRTDFLARMYRARANDLEDKGKTLADIRKKLARS